MELNDDPRVSKSLGSLPTDDGRAEVRLVSQRPTEVDGPTRRQKMDEFMRLAKKRWNIANDAEGLQRRRSLEEVRFNSGDHWDEYDRNARDAEDRVVIEVNRTPQYLNQVGNEMRMTRPQIIVKATGDGADPETAKKKNGIIRSIQKRSGAEGIRDDAFYGVLEKGWAHWRVNVDWENERSSRQVIRTGRIANDFSVYTDPAATEQDKSDADFRFITEDVPIGQYNLDHPDSELASMTSFTGLGDDLKDWVSDKVIRKAEYWYRERTKEKLYFLADDPTKNGKFADELEWVDDEPIGVAKDHLGQLMWRWSWRQKIKWALINAVEVLDGNEDRTGGREYVEGAKYIPIVTALGRRILIENKYIYVGMVRDAMAPCLASDYWLSALTEMVALGPKAPWIVAWEAVKQHQEMWDQANLMNFAALYYDHKDANGDQVPAPFRNFGEAPIQSMTFILKFADEDLKRVMGIYNAGLGAPGPEVSGVAINSRKAESDVANFNYIDNLQRAMEYEAKVYLNLMGLVMTEPQIVETIREDGTAEKTPINQPTDGPNGKQVTYLMGEGYDAEVEIGPSFNTKRQEAVAVMTEFVKADPTVAPLVDDLIADQMDFPNRAEFVKRLKSRVPPNLIEGDDKAEIPPQFQAQYDAQAQKLEQLSKLLEEITGRIESDERKYEHEREMEAMRLASAERIAALNANERMAAATMAAKSKADLTMMQAAIDQVRQDVEEFRKQGPVEYDFVYDQEKGLMPASGNGAGQ